MLLSPGANICRWKTRVRYCAKAATTLFVVASSGFQQRPIKGGAVDAMALRSQAERCRRLAMSIYNPPVSADLEACARQLDEQAAPGVRGAPSKPHRFS